MKILECVGFIITPLRLKDNCRGIWYATTFSLNLSSSSSTLIGTAPSWAHAKRSSLTFHYATKEYIFFFISFPQEHYEDILFSYFLLLEQKYRKDFHYSLYSYQIEKFKLF